MSTEALRQSVVTRFKNLWTATDLDKNVDYGRNQDFDPPEDGSDWVRIFIEEFDTENAEIGTTFQRTEGYIVVECFTKIKTGERQANLLAEAARAIFQNQNFDNVRCHATAVVRIGEIKNWYKINAKTFFRYDVHS